MKLVPPWGRLIRQVRLERGLLLLELADALGVSAAMLSSVELGKKKVPAAWLPKIKSYLSLNETAYAKLVQLTEEQNRTSPQHDSDTELTRRRLA